VDDSQQSVPHLLLRAVGRQLDLEKTRLKSTIMKNSAKKCVSEAKKRNVSKWRGHTSIVII
jgi:hypothetical protein